MPKEHLEPLFSKPWLKEINEKKKLIERAYQLKNMLAKDIWQDALRVYEAKDKYLNQLSNGKLQKFVKDLERMNNRTS